MESDPWPLCFCSKLYFSNLQCTKKLLHSAKSAIVQPHTNSPQGIITRTIWILSLVSLFTDIASEMLYPVMPLFLKHIGYTAIFIGVLEGVAEAVAGLSKSYFGKLSDSSGKRLPFVQLGYSLSRSEEHTSELQSHSD